MLILFTKMHGLGNDFVVIDAIAQSVTLTKEQIKKIADRHHGVGFDQMLLVEPAQGNADFRYVIYNADGSEVSQCGNGARCFALFVQRQGLTDKKSIRVETGAGDIVLNIVSPNEVEVNMGVPTFVPSEIPLVAEKECTEYVIELSHQKISYSALSVGNPHAVINVADIANAPVETMGKRMESHTVFPERANIGFSQIINRSELALRVYERGAGETLACGSGACAAAIAAIKLDQVDSPVKVTLPGGSLNISWAGPGMPVIMTGPATFVFDGTITI
jgi:diaminopimelate epimerase